MVRKKTVDEAIDQALNFVKKQINISEAFLFGSYLTGKPDEWSDIDLAVFSPDVEGWTIEQKAQLAAEVKLRCAANVELHIFSTAILPQARPTNFYGHVLGTGRKVA